MGGTLSPDKLRHYKPCGRGNITLNLITLNFSCDLTRLCRQRVMWPHRWFPVTIHHHPAKSGGISLIEEEILSFQFDTWPLVITWSESCNFIMVFIIRPHPAKFGGQTSSGGRNISFLVCHVTSWDYVVEGHVTSWVRSLHYKSPTCQVSWP